MIGIIYYGQEVRGSSEIKIELSNKPAIPHLGACLKI